MAVHIPFFRYIGGVVTSILVDTALEVSMQVVDILCIVVSTSE